MSFDAYWKRLEDATPGLRRPEGSMRIGVLAFRAAIRRAYETGRQDALEELQDKNESSMPDWMQGLFGRRR